MIRGLIYKSSTIAFFLKAFFRNSAIKMAKLLCLSKKRNKFLCFAPNFS